MSQFYDVHMLVPVTARVLARSKEEAQTFLFINTKVVVNGVLQVSTGVPEGLVATQVEDRRPTPIKE